MKSSFELLCCLPLVVMNSDEQFSDNVDKQMLIQLVNENVRLIHLTQNSKRAVFTALFLCLYYKSAMKFAMKF